MELKQKILLELKRINLGEGNHWREHHYRYFLVDLNPVEQRNFYHTMDELVNEDYLLKENEGGETFYIVTKKGESIIYK